MIYKNSAALGAVLHQILTNKVFPTSQKKENLKIAITN